MLSFKPLSYIQKKLDRYWRQLFALQSMNVLCLGLGIAVIMAMATIKSNVWVFAWQNLLLELQNWFIVPDFSNHYDIFLPSLILLAIVQVVMKVSPQPRSWSKVIIVATLVILTLRYLLWRSVATLNLNNLLNSTFSLSLLGIEIVAILSSILQLVLTLQTKNRRREADIYSQAVLTGKYQPSIDILIPTYNEPAFILKRTIIGCQAVNYNNKKIYLLDDKNRPEIKYLAKELGCNYITRSNNKYAKAGNLNNGIAQTKGELIVVFDADFVPTTNFLTRTVGFFQDNQTALVQTYQSFYNPDPVARNLGLEKDLPQDGEFFSRYYQPLRDAIDTAICYGSSFVVRRDSLAAIGGFVTESLSEDFFTAITLSAQGNRIIFLNESLSAGLCAENMAGHILQRLRWARGTLQAFFVNANPLKISGLGFWQRLAYLEGISQWFMNIFRLCFLLVPTFCILFGIVPWKTNIHEWLYFFLPFYLVQLATFSWLNYRSRSAFFSDIYAVLQCFPIAITTIQTLLDPFAERFRVTPKGIANDKYYFNWRIAYPSIFIFLLTLFSLWYSFDLVYRHPLELDRELLDGIYLSSIWNIYNLIIIGTAISISLDVPKANPYEWFTDQYAVSLKIGDQIYAGTTKLLSEIGAEIEIARKIDVVDRSISLEIAEENLNLPGEIIKVKDSLVKIEFDRLSLDQERRLVEILYCRPGRWQPKQTPSELRSIQLLLRSTYQRLKLFSQSLR
jgi:cellulose synthase (UDP-forming)